MHVNNGRYMHHINLSSEGDVRHVDSLREMLNPVRENVYNIKRTMVTPEN